MSKLNPDIVRAMERYRGARGMTEGREEDAGILGAALEVADDLLYTLDAWQTIPT